MSDLRPEVLETALRSGFLPRLRMICVALTGSGALFLGAPIFLSVIAPRPLPGLDDGAKTLDLVLGLLFFLQIVAVVAIFQLKNAWQRLAPRRPEAGEAWGPDTLAAAIARVWLIRYALAEGVCVLAGVGLFLAYQQGLVPVATRLALLGLLPVVALAWMILSWPDENDLRKAFLNS